VNDQPIVHDHDGSDFDIHGAQLLPGSWMQMTARG